MGQRKCLAVKLPIINWNGKCTYYVSGICRSRSSKSGRLQLKALCRAVLIICYIKQDNHKKKSDNGESGISIEHSETTLADKTNFKENPVAGTIFYEISLKKKKILCLAIYFSPHYITLAVLNGSQVQSRTNNGSGVEQRFKEWTPGRQRNQLEFTGFSRKPSEFFDGRPARDFLSFCDLRWLQ